MDKCSKNTIDNCELSWVSSNHASNCNRIWLVNKVEQVLKDQFQQSRNKSIMVSSRGPMYANLKDTHTRRLFHHSLQDKHKNYANSEQQITGFRSK